MQLAAKDAQLTDLGCIGLALVGSSLALAPLVVALARHHFPGRGAGVRRWGFAPLAAALLCIALVLGIAGRLFPIPEGEGALVPQLVRMACALGAGTACACWSALRCEPDGLRALGFPAGRQMQALLTGLTTYALFLPGLVGLMLAWSWVLHLFQPQSGLQPALQLALELPRSERWTAVLLGVLLLPLFEELLFRAFLQPLLVQRLHAPAGIALTALCFALLHGIEAGVPIFGLALILGGLMLRTQRLAACWGVHALHNALVFAMVFWFPQAAQMLQGQGLLHCF